MNKIKDAYSPDEISSIFTNAVSGEILKAIHEMDPPLSTKSKEYRATVFF